MFEIVYNCGELKTESVLMFGWLSQVLKSVIMLKNSMHNLDFRLCFHFTDLS